MKRKILSLILVLMLIPFASVFVACGKDEKVSLADLNTQFNAIADENNNVKMVDDKLVFDYTTHVNLLELFSSSSDDHSYDEIQKYNQMFSCLMEFPCEYVKVCAIADVDKETKAQLMQDLNNFKNSINYVNFAVNSLAEVINNSIGNVNEEICLIRYENLLKSYENMFVMATRFNNALADAYFNKILANSNPDVYSISKENFDAEVVVSKLKSRVLYQKSLLTQSFVEINFDKDFARRVARSEVVLNLDSYSSNIEAINKSFMVAQAVDKANANKEIFYDLAVQAQNIQATLNNDLPKYNYACDNIDYNEVVEKYFSATAQEVLCVEIINSNYELINEYNVVLASMLNIVAKKIA